MSKKRANVILQVTLVMSKVESDFKYKSPLTRQLGLKNTPTVFLHTGKTASAMSVLVCDTKPSGGETPVREVKEIWSTLSLPLFSGLF